jgi:hypothetical protein
MRKRQKIYKHVMQKHVSRSLPWICSICGRCFGWYSSVRDHLRLKHNLPFGREYDSLKRENVQKMIAECFNNEEFADFSRHTDLPLFTQFYGEVEVGILLCVFRNFLPKLVNVLSILADHMSVMNFTLLFCFFKHSTLNVTQSQWMYAKTLGAYL